MNSRIKLLAVIFSLSLVFTSCKKEEEAIVSDTPKEIILPRVQPIPTGNYDTQPSTQQIQQSIQPQQQINTNNQIVNQTPVITKPGMNPPHGQPGHRCDIQVGAPLNSPPASKPVQAGTATSKQITIPTPTQNTTTSVPALLNPDGTSSATQPGMNPAHGEEGHRCDIPVGAALPKE